MLISLSGVRNFFVFLLIVAILTLNFTHRSDIIIGGLVTILFFLNIKNVSYYFNYKFLILVALLCSIVVGTIFGYSPEFKRLLSWTLTILAFPYHASLSRTHYIGLLVVAIYLIFIQIGYGYFDTAFFQTFLDSVYPVHIKYTSGNDLSHSDWFGGGQQDLKSARYAGIFYNPNLMGQFIIFLYVYLLHYIQIYTSPVKILIYMIFLTSAVLTGSRTATVIMLLLGAFYFKIHRNFISLLLLITIIFLLVFIFGDILFSFRGLNIGRFLTGHDISGQGKVEGIIMSWNNMTNNDVPFLKFLFGIGEAVNFYDFELGYMLEIIGVFGVTTFLAFLIAIYRDTWRDYRYIFLLFLVAIGATVITNFRLSILIFIILSLYNSRNRQWLKKSVTSSDHSVKVKLA